MRVAALRVVLAIAAAGELAWSILYYTRPVAALSLLGRAVLDPVMARQYPLYLASAALAYALGALDPVRYRGIVWICVVQRAVEIVVAFVDWRSGAISTTVMLSLVALESAIGFALVALVGTGARDVRDAPRIDPRDRGLVRLLRGFGGLEVFWFLASTVFVQLGARLLGWPLKDPYTTQQQGIALLVIGLVSLLAASDISRYRILVWVPIGSQAIGMANSIVEVHAGSIPWSAAAIQWSIEGAIVGAFLYFLRHRPYTLYRPHAVQRNRARTPMT